MNAEEAAWVPIRDAATAWPGLLWWDVKGREREASR